MSKIILDASALLALLNQEKGYEQVEKHLSNSIMSAVNISEVIAVAADLGIPERELMPIISSIVADIIPFDTEHAYTAALIRKETKRYGLSLGDRACLALARLKNLPILTADKVWKDLELGIKINLIR